MGVKRTGGIQHPLDSAADASRLSQDDKFKAVTRYERYIFAEGLALGGRGHLWQL
jgi:hypothetical protein